MKNLKIGKGALSVGERLFVNLFLMMVGNFILMILVLKLYVPVDTVLMLTE